MQKQTQLQTGIHRHYKKGMLYFVREVIEDANTHVLMVVYNALYPVCPGTKIAYCRRLGSFYDVVAKDEEDKPISRFTLIMPLPADKVRLLLPGTPLHMSWAHVEKAEYKVKESFEKDGKVYIQLKNLDSEVDPDPILLSRFLNGGFMAYKGAE